MTGKTVAFTWDGTERRPARPSPTGRTGSPSGPPMRRTTGPRSQKVVTVDRRPAAVALAARPSFISPERRRPFRPDDARRCAPTSAHHRHGPPDRPERARPCRALDVQRSDRRGRGPGTAATRAGRIGRRRPLHVPRQGPRPGRQRDASANMTVRVDRTIRSRDLVAVVVHPAGRRRGTGSPSSSGGRPRSRWRSTRVRRSCAGSGRTAPSPPAHTAGPGAARPSTGAYVTPGTLQGRRRRDELDRHGRASRGTSTVKAP